MAGTKRKFGNSHEKVSERIEKDMEILNIKHLLALKLRGPKFTLQDIFAKLSEKFKISRAFCKDDLSFSAEINRRLINLNISLLDCRSCHSQKAVLQLIDTKMRYRYYFLN
jgi:hypothetical protein